MSWRGSFKSVGGFLFGFAFGYITRQMLKLIKRGGHKAPEQLALSVAMSYLVFYFAQIGDNPPPLPPPFPLFMDQDALCLHNTQSSSHLNPLSSGVDPSLRDSADLHTWTCYQQAVQKSSSWIRLSFSLHKAWLLTYIQISAHFQEPEKACLTWGCKSTTAMDCKEPMTMKGRARVLFYASFVFVLAFYRVLYIAIHKAIWRASLSGGILCSTEQFCLAAGTSGVIAVVIFGLYGSANAKWGMSSTVIESPVFDTFWDTISFMFNGIVFFYAGASSVNFFWRSSEVRPSTLTYHLQSSWKPLAPSLDLSSSLTRHIIAKTPSSGVDICPGPHYWQIQHLSEAHAAIDCSLKHV